MNSGSERRQTPVLKWVVTAGTLAGFCWAAFKYLDFNAMQQAWTRFSWSAWGWLVSLPALYLFCKAYRFKILMAPVSKASSGLVMEGYAASQAASLMPGGVALRAAMMLRLGIPLERSSGPILANSAADQFLLWSAGLVLCYYYPAFRPAAFGLTLLLALVLFCLFHPPAREFCRRRLDGLGDRFGARRKFGKFYDSLRRLWEAKIYAPVMFWTFLANLTSVVVLAITVSSLGFTVDAWALVAAFAVPGLLGRLSPLPAGAGVTEAGMIGFLANQSAMSYDQAAVATLIFRGFDIVLPALYGMLMQARLQLDSEPGEAIAVSP